MKCLLHKILVLIQSGPSRGKAFPPPPISPCAGLSFPVGCAPATAAAPLGPYLSAGGGQLFTARLRRAAAEGLRCAAFDCVTFVPCRPLRLCRTVRFSHIRSAAPTALLYRAETFGAGERGLAAMFGSGRGPGGCVRGKGGSPGESVRQFARFAEPAAKVRCVRCVR